MPRVSRVAHGVAKPRPWNVSEAFVTPEFRWAWQEPLALAMPMWEGGGKVHDYSQGRRHGTPSDPPLMWRHTVEGPCQFFDNSNDYLELPYFDVRDTDRTVVVAFRRGANAGDLITWASTSEAFNSVETCNIQSSGVLRYLHSQDGAEAIDSTRTFAVGELGVGAIRRHANGFTELFVDGVPDTTDTMDRNPAHDDLCSIGALRRGSGPNLDGVFDGEILSAYIFLDLLGDGKIAQLARDPFGPFRMGRRTAVLVPAAAVQFLRPDSDLANPDGWQDELGGTTDIYQSIDEVVADDADWIQGPSAATSVSFVGVDSADPGGTVTSIDLPVPSGVASGDVLVASVHTDGEAVLSATDGGWSALRRTTDSSNAVVETWWRMAGGSEPATYNFTSDVAKFLAGGIHAYRDTHGTTPIEASDGATGVDNTPTAPSLTSGGSGRMLLFLTTCRNTDTIDPPSGMTERVDRLNGTSSTANRHAETADESVGSGSTGTRSTTKGNSLEWAAQSILIQPA